MPKRWRPIAVIGIWLGLAVASAAQARVALASIGRPMAFGDLLLGSAIDWGSCAVFTPIVLWLVARYPAVRRPVVHLPILAGAIAVLVVAKYALQLGLEAAFRARPAA